MTATAQSVNYQESLGQSPLVEPCESLSIPANSLQSGAASKRCRVVPRCHHLFLAGDEFRHAYVVVSGSFKVYATSRDGGEQVLGFFLPGDALGLEAATSQTHVYSAVALEDAELNELSLEPLHSGASQTESHDRHELLQRLCLETIANNYLTLRNRSSKFAGQRLSSFLLALWDRLDGDKQSHGILSLTMSRQDIGDYLGLALGTISRTFTQLEQQELIEVRCRSVKVLDPDSLRRLAHSERYESFAPV